MNESEANERTISARAFEGGSGLGGWVGGGEIIWTAMARVWCGVGEGERFFFDRMQKAKWFVEGDVARGWGAHGAIIVQRKMFIYA